MTQCNKSTFTLFLTLLAMTGCASHRPAPDSVAAAAADSRAELRDSSVEITYVLGHSHRRFMTWTTNGASFTAQAYLDRQILKEGDIDQSHYSEFFSKATQFIAMPHRTPAERPPGTEECRSPFTVTVRVGTESKSSKGCRNLDEGALSHLVRDGEFLLLHSIKK